MTSQELYGVYAAWTGQLHFYVVKHLGRHVDVEYFPNDYLFRIYSGHGEGAQMTLGGTTVPALQRPEGERSETIPVPRPEDNPSQEDLEKAFAELCLAVARVSEIPLGKKALPQSKAPESAPKKKHAFPKRRPKRLKR